MANLKDIKVRIASVKNTAKITNAMKLVSAAKFARASHAVGAARPFSDGYAEVVQKVLSVDSGYDGPFVQERAEKRILMAVVSTDRGLCGGLNSNLFRFLDPKIVELKAQGKEVTLVPWGRKAAEFVRKAECTSIMRKEKVTEKPTYSKACDLAGMLIDSFCSGEYDSVYIAFPQFESALTQEPKLTKVLPLSKDEQSENAEPVTLPEIYPATAEMVHRLLLKRLNVFLFQVLLDATASEHGSRMSAMDSATRNAKEVNKKLTINYNRARQAAITTELIEITSGAAAL